MNTITKRAAAFTIAIAAVAAAASPSFARTQRTHSDAEHAAMAARHAQNYGPASAGQGGADPYYTPSQANIYQCKIDDGYGRWSYCDSGQGG